MSTLTTVIWISGTIVVGAIAGYAIARIKLRRFQKNLDREINNQFNLGEIKKAIDKQNQSTMEREVRDNGRRDITREQSRPIQSNNAREPEATQSNREYDGEGRDEGRSKLQDTAINQVREEQPASGRNTGDDEEDWPDFS